MLPFGWFTLPCLSKGVPLRAGFPFGDRRINGCMHLPDAYRSLPRPSSSPQPSHPPDGVLATILKHTQPCMAIIVDILSYHTHYALHPVLSYRVASITKLKTWVMYPLCMGYACMYVRFAKEVIRPQVPLRPPCYDFSPLSELTFDDTKRHHLTQAHLG